MQEIPDLVKPISWLAGRWSTKNGKGVYPDIPDFSYHEDIEFICIGQPMLIYSALSRHPETQAPMHVERGFLRIKPDSNHIAFVVSHNFGLASVEEGTQDLEKKEIILESVNLARISFAKPPEVKKIKRIFRLIKPNMLEVTMYMETEKTALTQHLNAIFEKIPDSG